RVRRRSPRPALSPCTTLFRSHQMAEQMAAAAEQQSLVAEDIARQINSISQATNDNAEVTGNSARLGSQLQSTAVSLHALVERFKDRKSTRLNSSHVKSSYAVF